MGDWTHADVTVHACPPHRVRAVLEVLQDYDLAAIVDATNRQWLQLGDSFSGDFPLGALPALVSALMTAAPDAAFTACAGPRYEWVETTYSYVPDLGTFKAECDVTGEALFRQSMTTKVAGESPASQQMLLGEPWRTAIADMTGGIVTEPKFYIQYTHYRAWDHVVVDPFNGTTEPKIVLRTKDNWVIARRGFERAHRGTDLDEQSKAELLANNPSWGWAPRGRITKTILYRLPSP